MWRRRERLPPVNPESKTLARRNVSAVPYTQAAPAPVKRPGVLTAGFFASLLSALAGLAGAIAIYVGGKKMVAELAVEYMGAELGFTAEDIGNAAFDEIFADAYDTLATRAGLVVFCCGLMLIAALLLRNGGLGGRVFFTVVLPLSAFAWVVMLRDMAPAVTKIGGAVSLVVGLVAAILIWLPAVNRYAAARKASKR
jgi:hypothetical protein